jgi:serine/threonine-protein kinase
MTGPWHASLLSTDSLNEAIGSQFAVGRRLGLGGQGAVFLATPRRGRFASHDVALKVYSPDGSVERVDREIRALSQIRSPHLARALEHGSLNVAGRALRWVAWEFVQGQSLRERIDQTGALSPVDVAALLRDISRATEALWEKRIVHRDIKPANIIFDTTKNVWVLVDLGLARFLDEPSITQPGAWCGTPGYMSPEQAWAEHRLTVHSDVFALGVTAAEACMGTHPTAFAQGGLMPPSPNAAVAVLDIPVLGSVLVAMLDHNPIARPVPAEILDAFGGV